MTQTLPVIQPDALRDLQARKPAWLKVRAPGGPNYMRLKALMRERNLHTVCEEARCPNIGECWEERTATFMILGDVCTRRCGFCAVAHGRPEWEDWGEPDRVGRTVAEMGLEHVVVTSVNRDDLADGGSEIFARTITAIRREAPGCRVEVLIPDFQGSAAALETVLRARPDVLNHNIETVPRLYGPVRPGSRYTRSLELFRRASGHATEPVTKSGMMLGLGEAADEVRATMADLRAAGVQLLTLGQYLRPSPAHLPVVRYVPPAEFEAFAADGRALGFRHVEAGPLVRSSYHAKRQVEAAGAPRAGGLMQYVPILMVFAIALGVACLLAYLPALLGPRRATPVKLETFECGKDVLARPEGRFAIKFSTTAIFFIIFDIELMFVFPWTVVYRSLGLYGFVTMVVYLGILMLGLLYVWRKGGLQWE